MTTASVHYDPTTGEPAFVLIDGNEAPVPRVTPWVDATDLNSHAESRRAAVDQACRTLGWKVMDEAPIVRQADGRGTIRIEPIRQTGEDAMRHPTAWISFTSTGDLGRVAVDGHTRALPPGLQWQTGGSSEHITAVAKVDDALNGMGYVRTTPIVRNDHGNTRRLSCTVRQVEDWRDSPTLIRMDDTTARVLGEAAEALGIPADELAAEYIRRGATGALSRHERWVGTAGYIEDPSRITGWLPDGSPRLRS